MPDESAPILKLLGVARGYKGPLLLEDWQRRTKTSYGIRCSFSRIMKSTKKEGDWIAYCDIFLPDGVTYVEGS